ncbi:MAG: hypothetical protein NTV86_14935 [Planctomycetota bacterium]|nr:hypothetical protein [Planctomycetota bacterium]
MNNNDPLDLEIRLDALIRGELAEPERQETLDRVATDESARRLLADMLDCRRRARQAFGYDGIEGKIAEGMSQVLSRLPRPAGTARPQRRRMLGWPLATAASLLLAAGIGLWAMRQNAPAGPTIQTMQAAGPVIPESTPAQLARLRGLWGAIASGDSATWILVRNGGDNFGQEPSSGAPAEGGAVSVRCVFAGSDGTILDDFQILVPASTVSPLAVGEAARLAGRPVVCDVSAGVGWVALHVKVDDKAGRPVGVQGTVKTGQGPVQIGEFRLGEREVKVFLQAIRLS